MNDKTSVSLELLLLNDLLHTGVIDQTLYDKALEKLLSKKD